MAQPVEVFTNSFEVTRLPTAVYFHFDNINPPAVVKRRNHEIIDRLQSDNATVFNPRAVYDGRKNMFCTKNIQSGEYSVFMGKDKTKPTHRILIKRVSIIQPDHVKMLLRPRQHGEGDNSMPLNLLQLIIRQAPNLRHSFPADARSFYVAASAKDLGGGLSAWRGYFQSMRPSIQRLIINIDVSHAAVYTPGPLISIMMQHLRLRDSRYLQELSPVMMRQLKSFLKGVLVEVTVSPRLRAKPISDLVPAAGLQEFDKEDGRWTVERHFKEKYNVRVQNSRFVGIKIGKTAVIPAEFCKVVPGQVYRKKIPPQLQKGFLDFATQRPSDRFRDITTAVGSNLFNYSDSDFMKDAGMTISPSAMSVKGVIITPPLIKYGGQNSPPLRIGQKAGSWNLVGRQFFQPPPLPLRVWAVVVFDRVEQPQPVQEFVTKLVNSMQRLGIVVEDQRPKVYKGNLANPMSVLNEAGEKLFKLFNRGPQLMLVLLPETAPDCRRAVKFWGDIVRGIPTQCVRGGKWDKANDQYCSNVALKINSRLGGVNSVTWDPEVSPLLKDSMVIGADVGHPGPGVVSRPSMTGFVATVDDNASVMTSSANVQEPRVEIIQDLGQMVQDALDSWTMWKRNKDGIKDPLPPSHMYFYRDGVSEGEFEQVARREISMIKSVFEQGRLKRIPKILFIIVGKRHHVRFFPRNPQDADRSGNCPAGLVIDKHITNPNYQDFYLQSHAGLLGTSRPSHYVAIENETALDLLKIQKLTFHLCHMYASATRSVSIPAPVYYADKICSRLEFHCANGASLSDTASNLTGGTVAFDLEEWRNNFRPTNLHRQMYFI